MMTNPRRMAIESIITKIVDQQFAILGVKLYIEY